MATDYKRLGALTSSGVIGTADMLYACGVESSVVSTVAISNRAATSATYRVAVSTATTFQDAGYLVYDATVPANDTIFLTLGVTLDTTNKYLLCSASATTVSFSAFGVENGAPIVILPTGGTITESGGYRIHTFAPGTTMFTVSSELTGVNILIIGGGGAGANDGGGGGAGGYTYLTSQTIPIGAHSIVAGAGGIGTNTNARGANGGLSSAFGISCDGGGGGGSQYNPIQGLTGASGGGGTQPFGTGGAVTGIGTGYPGGAGSISANAAGGGAGSAGGDGVGSGAIGGLGISNAISGTALFYCGGGGAGHNPGGLGGSGVGGNGGYSSATAGIRGSGGGGTVAGGTAGSGGAGLVIISYPL